MGTDQPFEVPAEYADVYERAFRKASSESPAVEPQLSPDEPEDPSVTAKAGAAAHAEPPLTAARPSGRLRVQGERPSFLRPFLLGLVVLALLAVCFVVGRLLLSRQVAHRNTGVPTQDRSVVEQAA